MTCAVDGCGKSAWRSGLCRGHWKRKSLGQPLTDLRPYGRSKADGFWDAVLDFLDTRPTDDEGWRKARERVEKAGQRRWGVQRTKGRFR